MHVLDITELAIGGNPVIRKKRSKLAPERSVGPPSTPTETVLVVEAEILARLSIAEYLRGCGYKVIEADSIEDAFKVLQSDAKVKVDVVLAEVSHLGAADGFALSKQIRETHPAIDVILTSSVAKCADKAGDLCEEEGMLGKPYHPEELLRRIHLLRERRRSSKLP
jgi:DNA-binding response OmpR family regulator